MPKQAKTKAAKNGRVYFGVHLDREDAEKLQCLAEREQRPVSAMVRVLIHQALAVNEN